MPNKGIRANWALAKRAAPLSAAQSKAVAKIATRTVLKKAETKSRLNTTDQQMLINQVRATNLIYAISQGDGSENVEGEKLHISNIRFRGVIDTSGNSYAGNKVYRVLVVQTKQALTNTNAPITASDIFRTGSGFHFREYVDLHKVRLLYDRTMTLVHTLAPSGQMMQKPLEFYVNIGRDKYFDADNSGYLKDGNYYLIVTGFDDQSAGSILGRLKVDWTVNFKDI